MNNQITNQIMMIRPAHFGFNAETAENNAFQHIAAKEDETSIKNQAKKEFDHFVQKLRKNGVQVIVVDDTNEPIKSDAVFPNNWISFHADGTIVTYPMFSPIRRAERREDIIDLFEASHQVRNIKQYEHFEAENLFLEGTGSMILDREHRIAYACLGSRTDLKLFQKWADDMDYEVEAFYAKDIHGKDIYHTNVMMAIGVDFVIVGLDTITNKDEKASILKRFEVTNKRIIELSQDQINQFAGNMLQVKNDKEERFLVMSEQAYKSLNAEQVKSIETHTSILHAPLYTIEKYGGGSARCMMAEVFLETKTSI